ncbi:uncharacterized protein PITG_03741 [Phytophthora infestans T30-4]|uniref:Uncharacterized protein n=1 Tax=Phytophthora infestans (strain T30-4) TaxID=403677 RepID=D0MYE0_PHYIT|nr:uncharacterized protein PITG_03741 [Phytophthora infestans T30-4]EEY66188.1 conserved hypothetical protein [Phytophthora infestans T30-4]|eukprot:XP_002906787.1 conserved hypothetical protein [Phytophthora infestans T30-4]
MQTTDDEFSSLKCRYASKRCWNLRAIKRNGERHNLCEMHRQKANSNQRRLDKKRKAGQAALGLPSHIGASGYSDLERRLRMRASIALKLEQELGAVPLTTQYIRSPSLIELQRAAGLLAMGSGLSTYSNEMDTWREPSSRMPSAAWMNGSYPRSPRAMLRSEAVATPKLLPPIATVVARSGEGLSSAMLQSSWHPEVRRAPSLVTRANI